MTANKHTPVDVLTNLEFHANGFGNADNRGMTLSRKACGNISTELRQIRAAVAELIEADLEVDEAEAECAKYPGEGSSRWLANAKARRVAALSRVRGAE